MAGEDRVRVRRDERFGVGFAVFLCDYIAGFAQARGPRAQVVGVGGEEVDPAVGEEVVGELFGALAPLAEDGIRRDLHEKSAAQPVDHALIVALEGLVAFGMGKNRRRFREPQLVVGLGEAVGQEEVGEFDQEVAEAVDAVADGVLERGLDVVVGEVEVAAEAERERDLLGLEARAKYGGLLLIHFGDELVL